MLLLVVIVVASVNVVVVVVVVIVAVLDFPRFGRCLPPPHATAPATTTASSTRVERAYAGAAMRPSGASEVLMRVLLLRVLLLLLLLIPVMRTVLLLLVVSMRVPLAVLVTTRRLLRLPVINLLRGNKRVGMEREDNSLSKLQIRKYDT